MESDAPTGPLRDDVPLLPSDWEALAPLIDAVLDAAPGKRAALILELSAGDAARQRALTNLVAECERETPLLDVVAAERFDGLAADVTSLLPELLSDRYRVGRELGRGGMARVYLARDLKLGRDVAIKVIRPELSASLGHDRFLREIEIAARLRHPNIVPLHDSGEVAGSLYFVMPYEEGPSLRERLQGGALPVADAVSVMRDVARALAYAHEHGVVHRDIKPDNVMLSGGAAVVTDFGIAKAVSAALTDVSGPTLTQSGSAIGTPAYMAPEQATGDPATDHRADVYSFGCLAYELFTGNPPFHSESMHLVIAAHLGTVPKLVTALRSEVPSAVAELLARCLEKDPAARPQSAREVLDSLEGAVTTTTAVQRRPARALRWAGLALAVAVIGTGAYLASRGSGSAAPITLAVLPFGNIGGDSTMDFVADGLPEEVATALDRVPGILIKSRDGARAYRGQLGVDLAEAGARLKADYLMTGVVRQERGRWILSTEVTRSADATSLWGDRFNVSPDRQAGAAETIAGSLTAALQSLFPRSIGSAPRLAANQQTSNIEAYRLYLRGQEKLTRRQGSFNESSELFRKAIHEDTLFAPAYAGLSMSLALSPYSQAVSPKDVHDDVVSAARRALDLDPGLALPHVALALAYQNEYQWDSAGTEFQTAIRLDGRNVEARIHFGKHLLFRGRIEDGLRQLRVARAEDPASAVALSWMSYAYYLHHEMDSALAESRRALDNDPTNLTSLALGALVLLGRNLPDEARNLVDRTTRDVPAISYVIPKSGDTATALQRLRGLDAQVPKPWLLETKRAYTYLGLGDTARALSALERATEGMETWPSIHGAFSPIYADVFKSARFQALLRRMGLVP